MVSSWHNKRVIVIVGPTAVGKTGSSIELARLIDAEVVSADSMQVYRGMDIGTGKARPEETKGVKHHLLNVRDPGEPFSVAQYVELADEAISAIWSRRKVPLIVGGTGLYIRSLIDGFLFEDPGPDYELRRRLQKEAAEVGNIGLHQHLQHVDPESANRLHSNDLKRVIRALEVYYSTGSTISEKIAQSKLSPPRYQASLYGLTAPREVLYERINLRVDQMLDEGLINEVMSLLNQGLAEYLTSSQAIGYKELVDYIGGKLTFAKAVENLKKATRNYAKRQLSWFRRDARIKWLDITGYTGVRKIAETIAADFEKGNCR